MTVIDIPGSKSVTARALFLAAAAEGTTTLLRPLVSDDTEGFAEGLTALGYGVRRTPEAWHIEGRPAGPGAADAEVYCRDGATTARFLPTLAAAGHGTYRFDASAQMRRRPLGPLTTALRELGVDLRHGGAEGHHPLDVHAHGVKGGALTLDAGQSSQYLTALLMLGPLTAEGLDITVTDLVSEPYVEITLAMMRSFGADVRREGRSYRVAPTGYRARTYGIEPDASTASYFFAAAALGPAGRAVTVPGLGTGALQGDLAFVDVLRRMGADVETTGNATTVRSTGTLRGLTVNMRDISDTMPTLAALAPFADGPVHIEDVANTRVKECDRLDACAENLRRLGVSVDTGPDWIEIRPGTPAGPVEIATHGDHRIVMSFAVTALRTPGITFDDPGCVRKTFPDFHRVFDTFARTQ
ncbi:MULTISPECIES: 3-phosphoshikimate 1-carboxyvinyltransferase [unclassified Streptomyces]|uniref:3-phosphoshikimate 1-carboxyvinyltransferase n=1 Tax=unclassified Streptomyces TaxID=2593676 RepID=UPI0006FDFA46|nr:MULTISPECIES: 3-phosphoshikimate 1-carboxyvinyltransferase [unclassified Streptomyces]KQX47695.1 3-phosphoshikimate 1-carboxyvinyltransferase [Streptomyces sp. Root1304]KRA94950.1 3-phosphoshikimate 1-carboxyvinyltransferase [Streptomyces sp. Root66D1]